MAKVKKAKKTNKEVEAVLEQPIQKPVKEVTQATKQYIYENMGKIAPAEIARHCNLTEDEVVEIATSAELDISPEHEAAGATRIRRYDRHPKGGAIAMTAQQAMLDDRMYAKNLPNPDEINKQFGKDFEKIKITKPLN